MAGCRTRAQEPAWLPTENVASSARSPTPIPLTETASSLCSDLWESDAFPSPLLLLSPTPAAVRESPNSDSAPAPPQQSTAASGAPEVLASKEPLGSPVSSVATGGERPAGGW